MPDSPARRTPSRTPTGEPALDSIVASIQASPVAPPTVSELSAELGQPRQATSELLALAEKDGRLVRVPNDYKVVSDRPKHIGVLYWFPTATGHGLINRGMVDGRGYLTDLGRDAPERYRE